MGEGAASRQKSQKGSASFLKKRSKKLLPIWWVQLERDWAPRGKSFLLLFSKRKRLLSRLKRI
jgi:hypothetical protein